MHVASYPLDQFRARVVVLDRPTPLVEWCGHRDVPDAIVGGFFARPSYSPLGELRIAGQTRSHVQFDPPWSGIRACVQIESGSPLIARRDQLHSDPHGDLLQAGPLLVAGGKNAITEGFDREGFSAGSHQFDSDITAGRYPRAALALDGERMLAVACDGRTAADAGMTLDELAGALLDLGAADAINLDGGGSASLVTRYRLRNRPREEHGADLLGGRPIVTAIAFEPH
ncbi:MAG: phosphodiester glycosidase family protein [Solirubrobacterales bacterium]|nr:phosphodiester glycosidase family protein [Solirubrobacterales bacterium]